MSQGNNNPLVLEFLGCTGRR